MGSGPILRSVLEAQDILAEKYGIASDVWSVTSYKQLRLDALAADRWNALHPSQSPRKSHLHQQFEGVEGPFVSASDYVRLVSEQIAPWAPGQYVALGTDGFGRSESREALRRFFEIDAQSIVYAALHALAKEQKFPKEKLKKVIKELGLDPDKIDPLHN